MKYNKVTDRDIEFLTGICGKEHVFTGSDIHEDFTHDEMTIYGKFSPEVVVEARSTEQVSDIMKYADSHNIPVTPRGSGTGLCGNAVALYGGILLSLAKMDKILEFDNDNFTTTVEPGVLLMTLAEEAINRGMMYPPDPGEKSATIGGNVMTNAGGMRAIKYGVTRDYVLGMTAVLISGEIINIGGKVVKNSSGYSIKDLLIGSEGTLAVITQLTLKLIPLPEESLSLLIPFDNLRQCFETVPKILQSRTYPTAIEFLQLQVIEAAEEYLGLHFPDKSAEAYILLTFDANSKQELTRIYQKAADVCLECGAKDVFISDTEERQTSIWKARGAFLEAIKTSTSEMDECDVVIPRTKLSPFMDHVDELEQKENLRIQSFGHAGDGNLHIYLCKDNIEDSVWKDKCEAAMNSLYEKSKELGGQISGEHGIGHAKNKFLKNSLGETTINLMHSIKRCFDPKELLNPGKIF
ncbi:MAG: FAD-binding protein [Spirochaetales bacterium]|nr:FAD-binding protein [Spirochaetales bacterium]